MKRNLFIVGLLCGVLAIGVLLGGCGFNREEVAVRETIGNYDLSKLVQSTKFEQSAPQSAQADLQPFSSTVAAMLTGKPMTVALNSASSTSSQEGSVATPMDNSADIPLYAKYIPGEGANDRVVKTVTIDEKTGFATAHVAINLPGQLELYNMYGTMIKTKDATLKGNANFTLEKVQDVWEVIDIQMTINTLQDAPTVADITYAPNPAQPGKLVVLSAEISNLAGDELAVFAGTDAAIFGTMLFDTGLFGDEVAADGRYAGKLLVRNFAQTGKYLGAISTVAWGSFMDVNQPIKMTIQTFTMDVQ